MAYVLKTLANITITHAGSTRVNYTLYTAPAGKRALIKQFSGTTSTISMSPVGSYLQMLAMINAKDISAARLPGNDGNFQSLQFTHRSSIPMNLTSSVTQFAIARDIPVSLDNAIIEPTQLLQLGIVGLTGTLTSVVISLQVSGIEIDV